MVYVNMDEKWTNNKKLISYNLYNHLYGFLLLVASHTYSNELHFNSQVYKF